MSTKKTFTVNSDTIRNGFQKFFSIFQGSRLKIMSRTDQEYLNIPLLIAVLIAFIFPLAIVALLICSLLFQIVIEREIPQTEIGMKGQQS